MSAILLMHSCNECNNNRILGFHQSVCSPTRGLGVFECRKRSGLAQSFDKHANTKQCEEANEHRHNNCRIKL